MLRGIGGGAMRWKESGTNMSKKQKKNPTLKPRTPESWVDKAAQCTGLDSSLPLVHRSWSFKNQLYFLHWYRTLSAVLYRLRELTQAKTCTTLLNVQERNSKRTNVQMHFCHCLFDDQNDWSLKCKAVSTSVPHVKHATFFFKVDSQSYLVNM